jgi:hypothetical protein
LAHWVAFSPTHFLCVLKEQTQSVQVMPKSYVAHSINLNSMRFVVLDFTSTDCGHGSCAKEGQKRCEACFNPIRRALFLTVLDILTPSDELSGSGRKIPCPLSCSTTQHQLVLALLESFGGFSILLGGP